jgi:Tol biopolymer transport system component
MTPSCLRTDIRRANISRMRILATAQRWISLALAGVLAAGCGGDASTGTDASDPADRTEIAFSYASSQYGHGMAIFLIAADRSGLRQIANDSARDVLPDWSPDGRTLLFTRESDATGLWTIQADGSGLRQLSAGTGASYGRWSPDGNSIVFRAWTPTESNIAVMRADGSDRHTIATALVNDVGGALSWSKGGRIAFTRTTPELAGIWTVKPDGSGLSQLTSWTGDAQPRWSPDGTRLAFESPGGATDGSHAIFLVNADGTGRRRLTDGPDQNPTWSPDGKWIIFDRHVPYGYESSCPLYIVPSGGGDALALLPERTRAACAGSAWRAVP